MKAAESLDCPRVPSVFSANGAWAPLKQSGRAVHILAIGSSSTAGVGSSDSAHAYPAQLAAGLIRRSGAAVSVDNAGFSGETADATTTRLQAALVKGGYDLIIWQVGTNDAVKGGDLDAFRSELSKGITAAKRAAVRLLLLDPQFYPGVEKYQDRYETFVRAVGSAGAANGVPVLSRYAMMKAWSATDGLLLAMLSPDHFHMNDRGYACVAAALADRIADILPRPAVAAAPTAPVVPVSVSGK